MRKILFALVFILPMIGMITGCASQPDNEDDARKSFLEQKKEFKASLEEQLREIDGQIQQAETHLAEKGEAFSEETRKDYERVIAELKDFRVKIENKLEELDNLPDSKFEEFQQNFKSWLQEFKADFKRFGEATKELFKRAEGEKSSE